MKNETTKTNLRTPIMHPSWSFRKRARYAIILIREILDAIPAFDASTPQDFIEDCRVIGRYYLGYRPVDDYERVMEIAERFRAMKSGQPA